MDAELARAYVGEMGQVWLADGTRQLAYVLSVGVDPKGAPCIEYRTVLPRFGAEGTAERQRLRLLDVTTIIKLRPETGGAK